MRLYLQDYEGLGVEGANARVVLGEHPRLFKRVFALAQSQLKRVFGMEMRQLPIREKLTLEEKRKGER